MATFQTKCLINQTKAPVIQATFTKQLYSYKYMHIIKLIIKTDFRHICWAVHYIALTGFNVSNNEI
ncbi:hypothetical protein CLV53_101100 [Sediminibacterium magnilacihabitans]|jgi:hypothetical protein|nr:hypothetical protein CLV53_101100 [Sediminibacterium magnilacihabitans]